MYAILRKLFNLEPNSYKSCLRIQYSKQLNTLTCFVRDTHRNIILPTFKISFNATH